MVIEIPSFVPNPNDYIFMTFFTNGSASSETIEIFLIKKETRDKQISIELRAKGIITTPGEPFAISRRKEIDGLLVKGVFELIFSNSKEIDNQRIFGSRLVDEVKGMGTVIPYEKSRLVIQVFNDEGKKTVLT